MDRGSWQDPSGPSQWGHTESDMAERLTHTLLNSQRLWNFPGNNTGVGSHSLLQGIFPTQGLNLGFLHCRQILDPNDLLLNNIYEGYFKWKSDFMTNYKWDLIKKSSCIWCSYNLIIFMYSCSLWLQNESTNFLLMNVLNLFTSFLQGMFTWLEKIKLS